MEESTLLDVVTRAHFVPAKQTGSEEKLGKHAQEHRRKIKEQKSKIADFIFQKYKAHPELKGMLSKEPVFYQEIKQVWLYCVLLPLLNLWIDMTIACSRLPDSSWWGDTW